MPKDWEREDRYYNEKIDTREQRKESVHKNRTNIAINEMLKEPICVSKNPTTRNIIILETQILIIIY